MPVVAAAVAGGLEEEAAVAIVGVGHVAVTPVVCPSYGDGPRAGGLSCQQRCLCGAITAGGQVCKQMVAVFLAHHNIHGTAEGGDAACHELGRGQQFDALYHGDVHGQVENVVAGLRISEVDAVEKQHGLVEGASTHGEVSLHIVASARAQINARQHRNEVAKCADRRVGKMLSGEYRRRLG